MYGDVRGPFLTAGWRISTPLEEGAKGAKLPHAWHKTAGFIFWVRVCREFGIVGEFGFLYCYLTGAGFLARNRTKKALTQIACRVEAPSAQSFS